MTRLYALPANFITYDVSKVVTALVDAKSAVISLTNVPYRKAWAEKLQDIQLKQEVAGTSRIEGAEFTENELDIAISGEAPHDAMTRSQKQARAAVNTYRWIADLPDGRPINEDLVCEIHRRIVTGCDDDHCQPGALRGAGENVTFGSPRHRGCEGGRDCARAFRALIDAVNSEFKGHDILIQALAFHYHMGAMHPFLDGNGRTARAVEALVLQRAGLRDGLFIALSNYYYDEKANYLSALSSVASKHGDLTDFLIFGLTGIAFQCRRLLNEINTNIRKALFRDLSNDLFHRLASSRKRVLADRQLGMIHLLLEHGDMDLSEAYKRLKPAYNVKNPWEAFVRDAFSLQNLGAVEMQFNANRSGVFLRIRLSWPTEITETEFFRKTREMPKVKNLKYLAYEGTSKS